MPRYVAPEHEHQWTFWKEDDEYIYFKCTRRYCSVVKMISKINGEEIIG